MKTIFEKIKLPLSILTICGIIFLLKSLGLSSYLQEFVKWFRDLGPWAPGIFIIFYILTAGYVLPVVVPTMMGGVLFGVAGGSALVSLAFTTSSAIVYLIGRKFGEGLIPSSIQSKDKFRAVCAALKNNGFKFVFMLRFVPILSSIVLNMTCGMIKIKFKDFTLATLLGQLPGTILFTYSGYIAQDILSARRNMDERTTGEWAMMGIGIAATIGVIVFVSMEAKKELRKIQAEG